MGIFSNAPRYRAFVRLILVVSLLAPAASGSASSERNGMPGNREIFAWVQDIVSFGSRRTGSEAGIRAADYMAAQFRAFGLEDVTIEQGSATQWEAKH